MECGSTSVSSLHNCVNEKCTLMYKKFDIARTTVPHVGRTVKHIHMALGAIALLQTKSELWQMAVCVGGGAGGGYHHPEQQRQGQQTDASCGSLSV